MEVHFFAGALDASLKARILPLARALKSYNVKCKVIAPIDWGVICKGKLKNILSVALTHKVKEYIRTMIDSPSVVVIGRISTPQIYFFQKPLE